MFISFFMPIGGLLDHGKGIECFGDRARLSKNRFIIGFNILSQQSYRRGQF